MSKTEQDLINAADFASIELKFTVRNTTTKTEARKGAAIELIELRDGGMVLEVPHRTCSNGHNLMIEITMTGAGAPKSKPFHFTTTAKVEEFESLADQGVDRIGVALLQYDEKAWEKLQESFHGRQTQIEEFFKAARGY